MNTSIERAALLSTTLLIASALCLTGCDKKGTIPNDAKGRIEGMAAHLPASTEAAVFIGDVAQFRSTMTTINTTLGEAVPELAATQKQLEAELGFDPLDANAWKLAGIPDKSAVTIAFVNNRTVIMTYVEDRQKFDTMLADKAKKALDTTEAPKSEEIDGKQVKTLGTGSEQIAWLHDGKLAIIATSVLDEKLGGDPAPANQFVARLPAVQEAQSAAKTPQFAQFMKGISTDYAVAGYANMQAALKNEAIKKEFAKEEDPNAKQLLERFEKEAQVLGFGLIQQGNEIKLTAFYGADEATNKEIAALGKPTEKSPFGGFSAENTLLGLRTAFDSQKVWAYYMKNLPADQRQQIVDGLQQASQGAGLDLEKDVINNLTGNVGLYLYGLNIGGIMAGMNDPERLVQALNLALAVQFKDEKSASLVMEKMQAALETPPTDVNGVKVVSLANNTASIYQKGNLLVIGTKEFEQATALKHIAGEAPQGKLSGALGKDFASDAPYGGLYLNIDKIGAIVGAVAGGTPVSQVLGKLSEAALTTDSNDSGIYLNLRLILKQAAMEEKKMK